MYATILCVGNCSAYIGTYYTTIGEEGDYVFGGEAKCVGSQSCVLRYDD